MNRREIISSALVLPLVPYVSSKYKTPPQFQTYELWVGGNDWTELPFEDIMKGDTIRQKKLPDLKFKVEKTYFNLEPMGIRVKQII